MFDLNDFLATLPVRIMMLIPAVLSLTVHEWAHAWSAYRLGDDTAAREGRLNLNPLSHIDPVGTILLPLMQVPFGWAKPVPIHANNFRRGMSMWTSFALSAAAGPVSNLLLAVVCTVLEALVYRFAHQTFVTQPGIPLLLEYGVMFNIGLVVFNLLPFPPLDGSRIVDSLVPYSMRDAWATFSQFGPLLLLVVSVYGSHWLDGPRAALHDLLGRFFSSILGSTF